MSSDQLDRVIQDDSERKRKKQREHREITVRQYIEDHLRNDPLIAQSSPARLYEAVLDKGMTPIPEEERWLGAEKRFGAFENQIFGIDKTIEDLVDHILAGKNKASTGKLIALLVGSPGTGKSTTVTTVMKILENYSKRPIFVIKGCPKFEEPLHVIPRYMREEVEKTNEECPECKGSSEPKHLHLGIKIEGDLCRHCLHMMESKFKETDGAVRWWDVPVETFSFSVQGVRGLSSFEPSGEKSSDITTLSGRENLGITSTHGYNHPLAYDYTGKLPKAERGICEGIELLSNEIDVMAIFFSVAEEKRLEIQGSSFPHTSVDTVVIGHTNLAVYKKFAGNKELEGLHRRFNVIPVPYPLRVQDEVKVYRKLIEKESDFVRLKKCHIAPGTLELAALFAVLTRLVSSQMGVDPLTKAKIYNGDKALTELRDKDKKPIDIRGLIEEGKASDDIAKREGMFGVSSTDVLAALNSVLVKQIGANGCLTPRKAIRALREVFEHRMGYTPEELKHFKELLSAGEGGSVMAEYKDFVIRSVSKAYLKAYSDLAKEIFRKYVDEAKFYRAQKRKFVRGAVEVRRDDFNRPKEPDVKFLRSVEEHAGISEAEADTFRGEILEFIAGNPKFSYETYSPLAKAVEAKLLADTKDSLTLVLATDKPKNDEANKRAADLFDGLTELHFCKTCAKEVVESAAEFLNE
ncbi:MAG: hypothetical protein Q8Q92_05135 [bacterium]|nr:hypothetical protein [bacterium]